MKNIKRARLYILLFVTALLCIQIYLSVYFYTYSPVIFVLGVREFDYVVRPYVVVINCCVVLLYAICAAMYKFILKNNEHEELQRRVTLLYTIFAIPSLIACIALAIIYFDVQYVFVSLLCIGALLLFSSILCCDCWRERHALDAEAGGNEVQVLANANAVQDQVDSVRHSLAQIEIENKALEAELRRQQEDKV